MNIHLAPEANPISRIKCKRRSDDSSLAACCEPPFFKSEVKTLRPHLHLHGSCWFQRVNCIDLENPSSSEMCTIKYTWEQFSREFKRVNVAAAAIDAFWQIYCRMCYPSVPLGLVSWLPLSNSASTLLSWQFICPLPGLGHFAWLISWGRMQIRATVMFKTAQSCKHSTELHDSKKSPVLLWMNSAEYQRSGAMYLLIRIWKHLKRLEESSAKESVRQSR